jgi:c-di-GMP-binding flagellar brake protein YcgR
MNEDSSGRWPQPSIADKLDARGYPRFKLAVDIQIRIRREATWKGRTVDISESGISALMTSVIPLGKVVQLDFSLPLGLVTIHAAARQRTAFRYGFQFFVSDAMTSIIQCTCQRLATEQTDELGL